MNILSIDTTLKNASVTVRNENNETTFNDINEITHSEKLLPLIDKALTSYNLQVPDMDLLMCTNGPGSFTGCRIGISTIKGLSHLNNTNIIAVPSLELMAYYTYTNLNTSDEKYILSFLDARNERVYYALYKFSKKDKINIQTVIDISNDDIKDVLENLKSYSNIIFCGDEISKFSETILQFSNDNTLNYIVNEENVTPNSKYLINYYFNVDKNIIETKKQNTHNLDIIYARITQAERLKNESNRN